MNKEDLIKVLNVWNYWNKKIPHFVSREEYEKKIELFRKSKEVIVLKGIRRSGKSTLLYLEIKNLLKKVSSKNILFINFEEPKFVNDLNVNFLDFIYETYLEYLEPKGKVYIFLDEVQNIKYWEKWVRRMYDTTDVQIYITGSSSKLLSSEFSTTLGGRYLDIDVFPLSFKEFLKFKSVDIKSKLDLISKSSEIKRYFKEYMQWGGFPKVVDFSTEVFKNNELINYYETIILKDIADRYNLSNVNDLKKVSYYLLSNISKFYSVNSLKKLEISAYDTLKKYINFLKEVYLIFEVGKFDFSVKKQLVNPKKIYGIDTGLINAVSFKFSEDSGRLLENLVFVELKRRNKEVYYYKNKKECDFVIKDGLNIVEAIQVCKSLNRDDLGETKKREYEGLIDAMRTYNLKEGLILTENEEFKEIVKDKKTGKEFTIHIRPVWKWLLES